MIKEKAKRGRKPSTERKVDDDYFGQAEEDAVKTFLTSTSEKEKNQLFTEVIQPALKQLVKGIMRMPMFQKIIGIPLDDLEERAFYHVVFQITKFHPDKIGKDGKPVKAFSYLGTCCKNFILGEKIKADKKIAMHGETLDIDLLGDLIPEAGGNKTVEFEELKKQIILKLDSTLEKQKLTKADQTVGHTLKYMFTNWHKIEFQSKNEFIRQIGHYTQLDPTIVARSLKKFKHIIYDPTFLVGTGKAKKIKKLPDTFSEDYEKAKQEFEH